MIILCIKYIQVSSAAGELCWPRWRRFPRISWQATSGDRSPVEDPWRVGWLGHPQGSNCSLRSYILEEIQRRTIYLWWNWGHIASRFDLYLFQLQNDVFFTFESFLIITYSYGIRILHASKHLRKIVINIHTCL